MRHALPSSCCLLLLTLAGGCGPSAEEQAEQARYEQAQKEKDALFEAGFAHVASARQTMSKVVAAWPDAASPPAAGPCAGPADTVVLEYESVARYGQDPGAVVAGSALSDRSTMPAALSKGLDLQRRRSEAEARKAAEKVAALAEDDWSRFRGDALRELEPIRADLEQIAAAPRVAVFRAASLVAPKVTGDDSFSPGLYSGAVVIFDSASGAALCGGAIEATSSKTVTEVRMDGLPLADAVMGDLIGQAYRATVSQIEAIAAGSRTVPPAI